MDTSAASAGCEDTDGWVENGICKERVSGEKIAT